MPTFQTKLLRSAHATNDDAWAFLVLPKEISDALPRRGRTSVEGTINGYAFQAMLEPDGQLSHWLKLDQTLQDSANAVPGDTVTVELIPSPAELEPPVPEDLRDGLAASSAAKSTWDATTTIARIDWIHWIESAKQAKTRARRVENACDMLASGKKRVCCFDPSGYYSKSLSAPKADT
ncbi:YdeI/OmpD-associated family protein [Pollutimonas harenae]|uniref:DUF1905 domain-containing protein n=1 Tax=Pollutimonas harenae TaxID=657015 RepID=A0A853GQC3_9BURK|nr:YdeI/OmpD-associated family protein [Pollutimonas harenae]NYT84367.1 DUF1905 domain-containing protein [Pollutimonas harenae]TEA73232.1 DUF1905 domain-containing protein [Pollutimonas harenae]